MELECPKCEKQWDYTGNSNHYATCPDCKKSVKIRENQVEA